MDSYKFKSQSKYFRALVEELDKRLVEMEWDPEVLDVNYDQLKNVSLGTLTLNKNGKDEGETFKDMCVYTPVLNLETCHVLAKSEKRCREQYRDIEFD
jgi:hypothetical protein|tara:strand:+ start:4903 stop:5196 length:294 start_codon:yes stop_codon:yes gene_type:complete